VTTSRATDPHADSESHASELELDELLGDAITYEPGTTPPPAEEPAFAPFPETPGRSAGRGVETQAEPEPKVSPLYWAAAVVWSLPGGVGGWLLLRTTHPKTARKLLLVGIVSFVVLAAVVAAAIASRNAMESATYIVK
jgi:hypothetical protein